MAYFCDLTAYRYIGKEPGTVNVGWLRPPIPYRLGGTPEPFRRRLALFCENPVLMTCGYHWCGFCGRFASDSEVRVISKSRVYAAPMLIHHYIIAHRYRPPGAFIRAVMEAPLPDSVEFRSRYGDPHPHKLRICESPLGRAFNMLDTWGFG